ncbi:MAG: Ig-like domain-containing protein [Alphaproteobacteria bacterium]
MATDGDDFIQFSGELQHLSVTLVNAYSGYTIDIDEEKYVNNTLYDGMGGTNTLNMTSAGDVLFIMNANGQQAFKNIQVVLASGGDDIVDLSSTEFVLDFGVTIFGGAGNDILWGNAGNDTIFGGNGDDIIDGGPGNDMLYGGNGNDLIFGDEGDDLLNGGPGNDTLIGGSGNNTYEFSDMNFGHNIIIQENYGGLNQISFILPVNIGIDAITFAFSGDDLILDVGSYGTITLVDQMSETGAGVDQIVFSNNTTFDLRSVTPPNQDPVAEDDAFTGDQDQPVTGNVLANDFDPDGDTLSVIAGVFTTVNGGTVELFENGDFTYTPAEGFFGADSFSYTVEDGNGGSAIGNVSLDIAEVIVLPPPDVNLDIRVSHGNTAQQFIDSAVGFDLTPESFGVWQTLTGHEMGFTGEQKNAVVSFVFEDADTASVTLDSYWNSMKNVEVSSDSAGNITLSNFVHTDVSFGNGGNSYIEIFDAKRGFITTGDGDDTVIIKALTNNAHWSNVFDIKTGDGNDFIDFEGDKGITQVKIDAGNGDDVVMLGGNYKSSIVHLGAGNDFAQGGNGNDVIYGGAGDDVIYGGAGNDILYGGDGTSTFIVLDKSFSDDFIFPQLQERVNIKNLMPSGVPSLGVKDPNLHVDFQATATLTFREGVAGYNNSLGIYRIAEDGTIEMASLLWENVKTAGVNVAHQIDIPVGEDGGSYGFFIIADGDNTNKGYKNLDTAESGHIKFVYDYGGAGERAATIFDDGKFISAVYDDGVTQKLLNGDVYHTTERGGSAQLNADGKVHAVSGIVSPDNDQVLKIGFEDLWKLGDADFEDVLFEIDINEVLIEISVESNDLLYGGAGNDILYGEGGDDILIGGEGYDTLYGGTGNDMFVFTTFVGYDTVKDFWNGDNSLNITDILDGYDAQSNDLNDFVKFVAIGAHTELFVNADGQGNDFQKVAVIENYTFTDSVDVLVNMGTLIVDQSIVY